MADFNLGSAVSGLAGGAAEFLQFNAESARQETLERLRQKGQRELQRERFSLAGGEAERERRFKAEQAGLANEEELRRFNRQADLDRELTNIRESGRMDRARTSQANIDRRAREANASRERAAAAGVETPQTIRMNRIARQQADEDVKTNSEFGARGRAADKTLQTLKNAEFLVDVAGDTGLGARGVVAAKSMARTLGFTPEQIRDTLDFGPDMSAGEALRAMNTNMGLVQVDQTKGQISNYEMQLFLESVVSLGNSPEANRLIIAGMRAAAQREKALQRLATEHFGGGARSFSDPEWLDKVAEVPDAFSPQLEQRMLNILGYDSQEDFERRTGRTIGQGGATGATGGGAQTQLQPGQVVVRNQPALGEDGIYQRINGRITRVGDLPQ